MRLGSFGAACATLCAAAVLAVAAPSPEQAWQASLAEANTDWAKTPHAILKIQDAAYLGEGQSATLTGTKGQPATYKWVPGKADGIVTARFQGGHLTGTLRGAPLDEATLLKSLPIDANVDIQAFPTQVSAGTIGVRIMLFNQVRADAVNFKGVDFFPYDPSYRVEARFTPDPNLPPRVFRTSRGTDKQFFHAGDASFTLNGKTLTLPFYADSNDPRKITSLSAFFMDDLTGTVAYGAGRYVDVEGFGPFAPARVSIDFNYAYNPNCARSAFFTCPVAVDSLATAMKAGEKDPHTKH